MPPEDRPSPAPTRAAARAAIVDRTFAEALRDLPARELRRFGDVLGVRFGFATDGLVANPADTWRCPALHRALKVRARELQDDVLAETRARNGDGLSP